MKNQSATGKFDLEQYKAIAEAIDEQIFDYLIEQIKSQMPDPQVSFDTLYYIILKLATRTICVTCGNDQAAKQRMVTDFCKKLPTLALEAKIAVVSNHHNLRQ